MKNFDVIADFINKTPKTELHLHIEGSLEPELMFKLSKRNKVEIPFKSVDEIKSAYNFSNLDSFLKIYYEGSNVLINEEDFFDLTWEYILRCKKDNIVHTEIFFDPQSHLVRGVSFDKVINGIDKALKKAEKELGITSKVIMCFLRHLDEDSCFEVLKKACDHKDKIIGVGLDSSEKGNPPTKFKRLFEKSIEQGFLTVAHAGEEGPPEYIWDCLNILKVKRIDHGVQCLKDEKLVEKLKENQIPLTVCPLSNVKLCVFDKLENHTLKVMLNKGLRVMVNSDDPAYFGGYLNQNLIETAKALNLELNEIRILIENSFKSSFLDEKIKNEWLKKIN
tara:strand:- start:1008 stop:2012 length:1005 start_codon:yes stop_codon:yes gene_type:complete